MLTFQFSSGTETIKRGASPPTSSITESTVRIKESTSNNSIKQPTQDKPLSSSSSSNKSNKDEIKITESSSSGPSTSSIQSYDKPVFSKSNLPSTVPSSCNYKHYSSINTTKSSPIDKFVRKIETTQSSPVSKDDEVQLYNSISYSINSVTTASSNSSSNVNSIPTKTVSVKTNGSKTSTTVTNNFKLPPFPVYVPSTSLPSTSHLTSDSGLNSKTETSTTAFSLKYSDSPPSSSVTSTYSTTLSRLSSSSSSPSRTINNVNTSTLPIHLGKNNPYLYQSETKFTNSNVTLTSTTNINPPATSYTSPVTSYLGHSSNYNNVYSTLPKTIGSSSYSSRYDSNNDNDKSYSSSYKYSTDYYSNLTSTTNNSSNNGTSTIASSSSDNNMYRVQYSATNPFLDPVEPSPTANASGVDNISSLLRGSVSETKKKFEKLDSEEDLK